MTEPVEQFYAKQSHKTTELSFSSPSLSELNRGSVIALKPALSLFYALSYADAAVDRDLGPD